MAKKAPNGKRHNLQDATKPLDDFDRLARKRLGLPPSPKMVKPRRRRRWPLLLLIFLVACLAGYGFHLRRSFVRREHAAVVAPLRRMSVSFLDVGQGDSTLIQTPGGSNILIDTGPASAADDLFAELERRRVTRLDLLIISHPDQDHDDNIVAVLRRIPTMSVVDSGFVKGSLTQSNLVAEVKRQNIPLVNVTQNRLVGTRQDLDSGVTLSYLAPLTYSPNANNSSIILKIAWKKFSILCMGDAETDERTALLASGQNIHATILKVAHHGSWNGTDDAFLAQVRPEVAVISCGLGNRFGQPHLATLNALHRAGVNILRTDLQGTITIDMYGNNYKVSPSTK